jgi:hypothetical protein
VVLTSLRLHRLVPPRFGINIKVKGHKYEREFYHMRCVPFYMIFLNDSEIRKEDALITCRDRVSNMVCFLAMHSVLDRIYLH